MNDFYKKYLPYAEKVKKMLGQPVALTLAQWKLETGGGTSRLAKESNNLGGIKYSKYSEYADKETVVYPKMSYARYNTLDDFVNDYVRVLKLGYYDDVRKAYATKTINDDVIALGNSPYAEDPNYQKKLFRIIEQDRLIELDKKENNEVLEINETAVNNMSNEDLKKYAIIGLGILSILGLLDF